MVFNYTRIYRRAKVYNYAVINGRARFMAGSMPLLVWMTLLRFMALFMRMPRSHIVSRFRERHMAMQNLIKKAK